MSHLESAKAPTTDESRTCPHCGLFVYVADEEPGNDFVGAA